MIALLVIDMQVGLFTGKPPRHDADGVIHRINDIASSVRAMGGIVIFIQHEDDSAFIPGTKSWEILQALERRETDLLVSKQACDAFYETDLAGLLNRHGVQQLIITGCATDFCVDTSFRAVASREYEVSVVADAHTSRDRSHLDAVSIIRHHNWMWQNLILPNSEVEVLPTASIITWLRTGSPK